jgi:hypothetical protein
MKAIKMFGLAVLTALMAMAFVGAASAMAESTVLCKNDESPCTEGNVIAHVHETSVGKAKLLTSFGTTECNVLFLGDAAEAMEEGAGLGVIGSFTYTECTLGGSNCTATEENGPAELEVLKEGHETGKVTGEGLVHLVCGKSIDCSYNGTGLTGTAKGPLLSAQTPDNGEVSLSEQSTTKEAGGFLCPKTAKLDITTTPLVATYVSTPANHYCVKYEHAGHGFYLKVKEHKCETSDYPNRLGDYALIVTSLTFSLTEHVCVRMIKPYLGLYKTRLNKKECKEDISGLDPTGKYELGEID